MVIRATSGVQQGAPAPMSTSANRPLYKLASAAAPHSEEEERQNCNVGWRAGICAQGEPQTIEPCLIIAPLRARIDTG